MSFLFFFANEVSKSEGSKKVEQAHHFDSVLMLSAKNYRNYSVLVKNTACQIGAFLRHSVVLIIISKLVSQTNVCVLL